jgi:DNA-binding CsgD family transcriptional regulator
MAVVSPISRRQSPFPGIDLASAMLIITDPENVAIPTEEALRLLFDLTPAEAKLTRLLAEGCGLTEAAARLGVTRETLRTRLKSIFEKTNTHRQAELVRLVLNATPRL